MSLEAADFRAAEAVRRGAVAAQGGRRSFAWFRALTDTDDEAIRLYQDEAQRAAHDEATRAVDRMFGRIG